MSRRSLVIGICILLICSIFIPMSLGLNVKVSKIEQPSHMSNDNTLYVGGSGPNNYTMIQDAIKDANDYDTVFVYDDSSPYYEVLGISKSINLMGENKDSTVIAGKNGYTVYIDGNWVNISGFNIQTNGDNYNTGIGLDGNYCTIIENNILNNSIGLYLFKANNNSIIDNTFSNNNGNSIMIGHSRYNCIENNNILDNNVYLYNSSRNSIIDNSIPNGGILINDYSRENIISENNISNNQGYFGSGIEIYSNSIDNIIIGNNITNNINGIFIRDSSENNKISGNIILNNQYGITLDRSDHNRIKYNIILNNYQGIRIGKFGVASYNTIKNNTISNNDFGIIIKPQLSLLSQSGENIISKNNLIDNKINAFSTTTLMGFFSGKNKWNNNYYSNYRGGKIHIIPGIIVTCVYIPLPFLDIDWNPASEPYDI